MTVLGGLHNAVKWRGEVLLSLCAGMGGGQRRGGRLRFDGLRPLADTVHCSPWCDEG